MSPTAGRILLLVGTGLWLGWAARDMQRGRPGDPRPSLDPTRHAVLRLRRSPSGHLLVRPTLDGRDAGWFVLDTGASQHVVSTPVARALGWPTVDRCRLASLHGEALAAVVRGDELRLGPVQVARPRFVTADLTDLERSVGRSLAGILGGPLLEGLVCELDLRASTLRLGADPREVAADEWFPWHGRTRPVLDASLSGPRRLLIDTGFPGSLLLFTGPSTSAAAAATEGSLFAPRPTRAAHLHHLQVGALHFQSLPIRLSPGRGGQEVDGLLGCALLEPFRLFLDGKGRRVAFVPHATEI